MIMLYGGAGLIFILIVIIVACVVRKMNRSADAVKMHPMKNDNVSNSDIECAEAPQKTTV